MKTGIARNPEILQRTRSIRCRLIENCGNRVFSTTKNNDPLTEGKCFGKQAGGLFEESDAREEHHEEGTGSIYLQFLLIIRQSVFLNRVVKAKI